MFAAPCIITISLIAGFIVAQIFPYGAFLPGIIVGFVCYVLLGKYWWFKKYPQVEIESNYDDKYLGITVENYWQDVTYELDD